jgi:hypothetical protein
LVLASATICAGLFLGGGGCSKKKKKLVNIFFCLMTVIKSIYLQHAWISLMAAAHPTAHIFFYCSRSYCSERFVPSI